jgi:hypothetical protein
VVCIALLSSLFASPSLLHALARFGPMVADARQMSQPPEVTREHDAREVPELRQYQVVPGTTRCPACIRTSIYGAIAAIVVVVAVSCSTRACPNDAREIPVTSCKRDASAPLTGLSTACHTLR